MNFDNRFWNPKMSIKKELELWRCARGKGEVMSKESEKNFISKQNINIKSTQTPKNLNFEDLTKGKEILWVKKVRKTSLASKTLTLRQDEHQNQLFRACSFRWSIYIYQLQPTSTYFNLFQPTWKKNTNFNQLQPTPFIILIICKVTYGI